VEDVSSSAGPSRAQAGRVLGVDLGSVRIGLALSDPGRIVASPHSVLLRGRDHTADHNAIRDLVHEEEVTAIVVGLPLSLSGATGPAARAAEKEIEELRTVVGPDVSVVAHDERLTTISAERSLGNARMTRSKRRDVVDKVAAAVMLQSWLDRSPIATQPSGKTRR
jgi:putative Holliday junction resolvase